MISRNTLVELLLNAIPEHKIQYGREFKELNLKDAFVNEIIFNGIGRASKSEIVVAADGVNSKIKNKLFPENKLDPVHENEIVSIIKDEELAISLGSRIQKIFLEVEGLLLD